MAQKRSPGAATAAAPEATRRNTSQATPTSTGIAKQDRRPVYTIRLRPEPGTDGIRSLRGLLKRALRSHGLRCVSVEEERS